jgi:hypothetical protein
VTDVSIYDGGPGHPDMELNFAEFTFHALR